MQSDERLRIEAGSIDPPLPADVVVHLRLGDTHGKFQAGELNDIWDHGVSLIPLEIRNMIGIRRRELGWWHYIKTKCDYEDILKLIPNYTKRVILWSRYLYLVSESVVLVRETFGSLCRCCNHVFGS